LDRIQPAVLLEIMQFVICYPAGQYDFHWVYNTIGSVAMKPRGKFVLFTEMAEKWDYSEDELIQLAIQQEFNLYCLKPMPGNPSRMPFIIRDELSDFLPGKNSVSCSRFDFKTSDYEEGAFVPISPEEQKFTAMYRVGWPESDRKNVTVDRSELYLHQSEIADMEAKYPELAEVKAKNEIDPNPQGAKSAEQSSTNKETSSVPIISEPVDLLPSKDASESALSSTPGSEMVTATDTQLSLASENVQEGHSIAQAEKPKRAEQPKKKKEKAFPRNIDDAIEQIPLGKDDKELPPSSTFADLKTRFLSLEEIVSDKKKGRKGIFPFGKSTWYAGIKSGRFPKSFEMTGGRGVGWRGSDIYALLQKMGMI